MISQNRAVPILLVLTFAFILYLGGCFGSEESLGANEEEPTVVASTPTVPPVVSVTIDPNQPVEEPFYHTVEEGDRLGSIASKYGVTDDIILRGNPDLNANVLIVGEQIFIPGATTNNEAIEDLGPDRPDGVVADYVVQSGDTLGAIAVEWTISLEALEDANPEVDAATLQVNDLLVIPPFGTGLDPADVPSRTTPVPVIRQPGETLEHTVAAGDNISTIAETYAVTRQQIIEANGLPDEGNTIQVGQVLLIPPPPTPTPAPG